MVRKKLPKLVRIQVLVEFEVAAAYNDFSEVIGCFLFSLVSEVLSEVMLGISKFACVIQDMEFDPSVGFWELAEMAIVAAQEVK